MSDPEPFDPAVLDPAVLDPAVLDPMVFDPAVLDPAVFDPEASAPTTSDPAISYTPGFDPTVVADSPPASAPTSKRRRWLLLILPIVLLGAAALFFLLRGPGTAPAAAGGELTFAPAQPEEFLIVVAPFRRDGGEPQAIGGTLANDLRESINTTGVRIETLPRAPDAAAIPDIIKTFGPRVLVTGSYDDVDIKAVINLIPPDRLPVTAQAKAGGSALLPDLQPVRYELDAPQGNDRPLRYLQAWIRGQAYFWRGDFAEAAGPLQQSKTLLPRQVPTSRREAMDRFAAGLNWQLGYIAGPVQGNWRAARDLFRESMRQAPADPAPALGLAAALAQLNDLPQASSILRQALRNHPNAWQIYFALAEIALQQDDTAAAFANYDSAIALLQPSAAPADRQALADIYFHRGYYLLDHNDVTSAQNDLQQALDLGRNDVYLQSSLGWAAYKSGDYETAIRASAAARQLAPDRPDLAFNEALHLLAAGQIDAARAAYGEAIDLTLTLADTLTRSTYFGIAYRDLAELAQMQPELSAAIVELQERIDIANG